MTIPLFAYVSCSGDPQSGVPARRAELHLGIDIDSADTALRERVRSALRAAFAAIWNSHSTTVAFADEAPTQGTGDRFSYEIAVEPEATLRDRVFAAMRLGPDHVVFRGIPPANIREIVRRAGATCSVVAN